MWLNWLWSHLHLPALEEAKDICTYLRPLQRLFEDMENAEFPDVRSQIGPLMHTVCLVWANSRYYNTPARLIVLLQETANLLIQQVNGTLVSVLSISVSILRASFFFSIIFMVTSLLLRNHCCGVSELSEIPCQHRVGGWYWDFLFLNFLLMKFYCLWVELSLFFSAMKAFTVSLFYLLPLCSVFWKQTFVFAARIV